MTDETPGLSAFADMTGQSDRPPVRRQLALADNHAALHGSFGVLAALRAREAWGRHATSDILATRLGAGEIEDLRAAKII